MSLEDGASAAVAVVGNEGIVGVSLFLGGETTTSRAVVQSDGPRLSAEGPVAQGCVLSGRPDAACPAALRPSAADPDGADGGVQPHHTVDQQLRRWLLLSLDHLSSNELVMTQELIANMLGVRREGVTEAAGKSRAAGPRIGHRDSVWPLAGIGALQAGGLSRVGPGPSPRP